MAVSANRNMLWASALVEELARSGVVHACIAPGNRSGPLAFAFAARQGIRCWSHVDERSAGFFALGLAKATRAPAAVVCTSGTAAANLHPAVVEACYARVPMLVLTADRPRDLHDVGANQAIAQAGMYGDHVRWACNLGAPLAEDRALRHLRALACRAVAESKGPPAGPVHLNVPFPKPLEPTARDDVPAGFGDRWPLAAQGRLDGAPFARVANAEPWAPDALGMEALRSACSASRGVIVAGPHEDPLLAPRLAELAVSTGFPLLADALSGARFGLGDGGVVGGYDAALQSKAVREALVPAVALRFGAAPTSDALLSWLEERSVPQVVVDEAPWREPGLAAGERVLADPVRACEALLRALGSGGAEPDWAPRWRDVERAVQDAQASFLRKDFFEGAAVAAVLDSLPEGADLFVSNSLAVRELDRFGAPTAKRVRAWGNRGASGIDGITSTALGIAAAREGPMVLVTGDLAFLHDLPGLLAIRRLGVEATIVVLHNDGGRIFDQLPAAAFDPPYTDLFATPHGLDFGPAARMFGARFANADDVKALGEELGRALEEPGAHVVQARFDPTRSRKLHADATSRAARAAEAALHVR